MLKKYQRYYVHLALVQYYQQVQLAQLATMLTTIIATGTVLVAQLHPLKLTILLITWALLQYSNNNSPGASVKSISYDAKHNPYYEVEGYYNHRQVEIKVDEATGQIVGKEVKGYTIGNKAINVQNIIIPEVAETKAIEKVGADFQTMEWTVERENGRAVYKFDMTTGGDKKSRSKS